MTAFQVGERVVHDWGRGRKTYGTILGSDAIGGVYLLPENTNVFGRPIHLYKGTPCYNLTEKYIKRIGPPLSPQEKVLQKIKSLDARFEAKSLSKTTMKPLALPR